MGVPLTTFSDEYSLIATIDPQDASADKSSDVIDMRLYHRVVFILLSGALAGATATMDLTINGDTASGGSFATAIAGKSLSATTFSNTGTAGGDNKQAMIEVDGAEVAAQGLRYIRGDLVVTNSGGLAALAVLGAPRYRPAGDYDLASVAEIVA